MSVTPSADPHLVFGFDLGSNSIGWAVLEENPAGQAQALRDMGVRIFPKAVEEKTPTPKNHKRRQMRLARRVLERRARRRRRLQNYLILLGLLPDSVHDVRERERVLNTLGDPYALRAQALEQALSAHQLGRVIAHLGMRRGFQSNRKTLLSDMLDDPDVQDMLAELEQEDPQGHAASERERIKEEGQFKQAISALQADIHQAGCRTLGQYLASLPSAQRKRGRRIGRDMIRDELRAILAAQRPHHAGLDDAVCEEIERIIFHQRPLRWDRASIGACSLEKHRQRAAMARLEYQEFRLLQDINHLRYDRPCSHPDTGEILGLNLALTEQDRTRLLDKLASQQDMSWSAVKKLLGLDTTITLNLEAGSKKGLPGNRTASKLANTLGADAWRALGASGQAELVEDLLKFEKKSALKKRLMSHWALPARTAIALATLELEPGHANLSLKAIRRLLPFMRQGMRYDQAREAAGYGYSRTPSDGLERLPRPDDLRNPVVNRALHEFRRVCNALLAEYGRPHAIRIELPRELAMGGKRKAEYEKQQKRNQKANEDANTQYQTIRQANPQLGLAERVGRLEQLKYRLWRDQNERCLYSDKPISMTELFSAEVEVDHILPYSRTVDDSYMNKALVMASENRFKGNRTPYEAYSGQPERWERMVQCARHLPLAKRERLLRQELSGVDDFINNQLTDTAYLSRQVLAYVQLLGSAVDVSVSKGVLTAWLRRRWGLNPLLGGGEKNRADHRHHAVDAAVIACVNRSLYQKLVKLMREPGARLERIALDAPFAHYRDSLAAHLDRLCVSHAPLRKLSGALHEETVYAVQRGPQGEPRVVYRKPLDASLKLDKLVDDGLRRQLQDHLARFNNHAKQAFAPENLPVLHPGHGPVRRVRVVAANSFNPRSFLSLPDRQGQLRKHLPFGSNHHVEILRDRASGKVESVFVTMWEAAQRAHQHQQALVQTKHGADKVFLMALHINDLVLIQQGERQVIYRVQNLDPGGKRLMLRHHCAATLDNKQEELLISLSRLVDECAGKPLYLNVLGKPLP